MPLDDRGYVENGLGNIECLHHRIGMVIEIIDWTRSIEPLVSGEEQQAKMESLG